MAANLTTDQGSGLTHFYSYGELKKLWVQYGGSQATSGMAAAIALAESGGNPNATHTNSDGSIDRGLWQVNSVHGAQSSTDVATNTKAAVAISAHGTNWNPWTTFKNGDYKNFLGKDDSYTIGTTSASGAVVDAATSGVDAATDAVKAVGSTLQLVFSIRGLELLAAVILGVLALRTLGGHLAGS